MKIVYILITPLLIALAGCTSDSVSREYFPEYAVIMNEDDSLVCRIVSGGILATRIVTAHSDTMNIDNSSIHRIIHLATNRDVTDRYIDGELLRIELAKITALKNREELEAEVTAGTRKKTDLLLKAPFEILSTSLHRSNTGLPSISITILNLGDKKISLAKVKVYCMDKKGRSVAGLSGRDNIFRASSHVPIGPGEQLTSTLTLRYHPGAERAKVEIYYLEFADKTIWLGKVEDTSK